MTRRRRDVVHPATDPGAVQVSNPDRVLFPEAGLTKADVVEHYRRVGEVMLTFVADRPLTLQRFPRGIAAKGFMQILSKDVHQSKWMLVSAASSEGCILKVYDPFQREQHSYDTKCKFAKQIRFTDIDRGYLTIQVMDVTQVLCHKDTGLLVMAFTTDILHGIDPTTVRYADRNTMKLHFNECFRKRNLTPFPRASIGVNTASPLSQQSVRLPALNINNKVTPCVVRGRHLEMAPRPLSARELPKCRKKTRPMTPWRRQGSNHNRFTPPIQLNKIKYSYYIELYCLCHMPFDDDMDTCYQCDNHFHPMCLWPSLLPGPDLPDGSRRSLCHACRPQPLIPIPSNIRDPNLKYDLFVSFSYTDMRFVRNTFMRHLDRREGHGGQYDLMICERDWPVGAAIADNIVDTMSQSLKAVVILSKGFLRGKYTHYEWQRMVDSRRHASAVILLDRPDELEMSSSLRTLLQQRIYLEWTDDERGQERFWRKMKEFLGTPLHQLRKDIENEAEPDL